LVFFDFILSEGRPLFFHASGARIERKIRASQDGSAFFLSEKPGQPGCFSSMALTKARRAEP
jgi:hypothetical protein